MSNITQKNPLGVLTIGDLNDKNDFNTPELIVVNGVAYMAVLSKEAIYMPPDHDEPTYTTEELLDTVTLPVKGDELKVFLSWCLDYFIKLVSNDGIRWRIEKDGTDVFMVLDSGDYILMVTPMG